MIEVFVCDDDISQKERITKCVTNTILIENLDMKVALSTTNPFDIIAYLKNSTATGLYFLDVHLNTDINGINLAEQIREYDPRGFIVFITTYSETLYLTFEYKVEAMDFIIKDDWNKIYTKVHQCILNAHKKYNSKSTESQKKFTFQTNEKKLISLEYDNILYFETSKTAVHKITVHAIDRILEFYGNLNDIEKELQDTDFFRCHKSFLVNVTQIDSIDVAEKIIFLKLGATCFASARQIGKLTKLMKVK